MPNSRSKYVWIIMILLAILFWSNRDDLRKFLRTRPRAQALDINTTPANADTGQTSITSDEKNNIDVFEKIQPAVVNIVATILRMNFWMEIIPREGQGSGFIINKEGYILTNNHVVAKAQKISVIMDSGEKIPATLIGRDPTSDLAVIKIPSNHVRVVAQLGDSDRVRIGQKAIAIGNPFGLSHTLTTGIISALNRSIRGRNGTQMDDLFQTDAAINPGNSGGPLLNSDGEVIGINTAILSLSGGYQGIGFAIPINRAKEVAMQLITTGRVARPWLGITGVSLSPGLSEELGLNVDKGVLVVDVLRGSSADRSGIRGGNRDAIVGFWRMRIGGDIIVSIDGNEIADMNEMTRVLNKLKVGQTVTIKIIRRGKPMELSVLLSERPLK
jgi:serine protease Do